MPKAEYIPGDNWVICDLSGKKIRMSESVKTWDGLRVSPEYWYPKHPQLSIRAIPETRMAVIDGRPRPSTLPTLMPTTYLASPGGTVYQLTATDLGALIVQAAPAGTAGSAYTEINGWRFTVTNGGTLNSTALQATGAVTVGPLELVSSDGTVWAVSVDSTGAIVLTDNSLIIGSNP